MKPFVCLSEYSKHIVDAEKYLVKNNVILWLISPLSETPYKLVTVNWNRLLES